MVYKYKGREKEYKREWGQKHKEYHCRMQKKYDQRRKIEVLAHYSTGEEPICARCGITDVDILVIDHIAGGGEQHRKRLGGGGTTFYKWLVKNNFPGGFQVLCHNCNIKKYTEARKP